MNYLQYKQEVTSNNIANANTTGFKKDSVFWRTLQSLRSVFQMNSTEQRYLDEVHENYTDHSQGFFHVTHNPLDFALEGTGFFGVETPQGVRYTRNGNLTINQERMLMTNNGHPVLGINGPIVVQGDEVWIDDTGMVYVDGEELDQLVLVEFNDLRQIVKIGDGLYDSGTATPIPGAPNTIVRQGMLEGSNVNPIEEMVNMIATMRNFETGQKSIVMQDETVDQAVNQVGRITR
jgi:flagellar basal-body rod protein FlgG